MRSSVLTDGQIERVHDASLRVLSETGVLVPHVDMLERFSDAGATVHFDAETVRIPPELVEKSLAGAGKAYTLYGREASRTARFGQGSRNYNAIAGEAHWVEKIGGPRRFATLDDVAAAARCCDALDHINITGAMSDPHEVAASWRCVAVAAAMIRNTTKPITFWYHDRKSAAYVNEMLVALRGDEERAAAYPLCCPVLEPISPLRFPRDGIDVLYETARLNLPVPIGPMAQMGLSAPMSKAGTLALENAEILAGICITQLIRPGMPVCYGGICHAFDMRTTQMIFGGPEQAIFGVAMTQMGKRYRLPVYINVGLTDSKCPDAQAGLETGVTLALGAAAGADIFGHMGICGVDQASSLDMLVLQEEIIAYVEDLMGDLDFSDEAMGMDLVAQVGPGGSFIDTEHTARRFRGELWFPGLLDRRFYEAWRDGGASDVAMRCRRRREELLETHEVTPLDADVDRELTRIVESAERELS